MSFFAPIAATKNGQPVIAGRIGEVLTATNKQTQPVNNPFETNYYLGEVNLQPGVWLVGGIITFYTQGSPSGLDVFEAFIDIGSNELPTGLNVFGWRGFQPVYVNHQTSYYNAIPSKVFNVTSPDTYFLQVRCACSNPAGLTLDGQRSDIFAVRLA